MKRIVTWWHEREERKRRQEHFLAMMVVLTATMPGNPEPKQSVRRWVNRTLRRHIFEEGPDNG